MSGVRVVAAAVTLLLVVVAAGVAVADAPGTRGLRVVVEAAEVAANVRYQIVADDEIGGAPAARLTLTRTDAAVGADVKIVVHPGGGTVFTGEIAGIEPVFGTGGESSVLIRAFNRLHRLTSERRSRTFENKTDAEIVATIAAEHGLSAAPDVALRQRYPVVTQQNQTDLSRARRPDRFRSLRRRPDVALPTAGPVSVGARPA